MSKARKTDKNPHLLFQTMVSKQTEIFNLVKPTQTLDFLSNTLISISVTVYVWSPCWPLFEVNFISRTALWLLHKTLNAMMSGHIAMHYSFSAHRLTGRHHLTAITLKCAWITSDGSERGRRPHVLPIYHAKRLFCSSKAREVNIHDSLGNGS